MIFFVLKGDFFFSVINRCEASANAIKLLCDVQPVYLLFFKSIIFMLLLVLFCFSFLLIYSNLAILIYSIKFGP